MQGDKMTLVASRLGTPTNAVNVGSLWQPTHKAHLQQLVHLPASRSLLTWRVSQPKLTYLSYAKLPKFRAFSSGAGGGQGVGLRGG